MIVYNFLLFLSKFYAKLASVLILRQTIILIASFAFFCILTNALFATRLTFASEALLTVRGTMKILLQLC